MAGISQPLQLFGDFGFSGGEDVAPNPLQDNQTCINWYAEVNKQNAKEILGLLGCPGLVQLVAAPGGGAPNAGGPSSTIALLHFDGANGSTAFPDAVAGNTWTPHGSAQISTSSPQFGTGSFSLDGSTAWINTPNQSKFQFGASSNSFTIECWIKPFASGANYGIACKANNAATVREWLLYLSGGVLFFLGINASNVAFVTAQPASNPSAGAWSHIAVVNNAGTFTFYLNGVGGTPVTPAASAMPATTVPIAIGSQASDALLAAFKGNIDEFRMSSAAIYTANFMPPAAPFTISSGGVLTSWPLPSTVTSLVVRGLWELPDDKTALAVIGNTCYLVTVATPANPSTFATLALTSVGTLQTLIGPVHIRDNNVGGYAVIVDGPYGYLYNIKTRAFTQITDPAFLGADTVAFIDGWWIFNQPGTQVFYTQAQQYGITFNASNFALKDSSADNLVAVFENKEQLWLIGDKTTEIWYDAGGQYFAFQRLVGTPLQLGCKAKHSVSRFSSEGQDGLIWFGRSERGENGIVRTRGFAAESVSTPAFSAEVATYPITSDAIGYTYQEDTHEFYVLIFPTADVTWCYDAQTGLLHKRLSYDPYLQKFHRHRSNCFMNFQGMRIVGDYQNGALYQLTRNAYTDAGWPLLAKRRSPHIWDKGQRGRVFMASLQLDFNSGVGNATGLGSNPQAGIAISRDGGKTFGQRWYAPIGQIGQYRTRTMWRKLAFARDSVVDLEVIDPVKRDLVGVTLKAFSSA